MRHHYIPQFYLRRFSDAKGRIRLHRAGQPDFVRVTSVKNAAVETAFYQLDPGELHPSAADLGVTPEHVEKILSIVDGQGSEAIKNILAGKFPPTPEDRFRLSQFLAYQILRTPENRAQHELSVERMLQLAALNMTREEKKRLALEAGIAPEDVDDLAESIDNLSEYG